MLVRVAAGQVDVVDTETLTALSVSSDLDTEETKRTLLDDGLARRGEGRESPEHVWLDVAEIARRVAPMAASGWSDQFAGMIHYAAGQGWTDPGKTLVRAHIEVAS